MGNPSGAGQTLTVGGVAIHGYGTGFTGFSLVPAPDTFTVDGGGYQLVRNAGPVTATGGFGVGETALANSALLGQNAARKALVWVSEGKTRTFEAILQVSRTLNDAGARVYAVAVTIDGDITIT